MIEFSDPILTAQESVAFEEIYFQGDSEKEWTVIRSAGTHVAHALLNDFLEYAEVPVSPRILVIIGKGHNAADALIAAQTLLETCRDANIDVVFVFGELSLKPLAKKAWIQLQEFNPKRVNTCTLTQLAKKYSVSLDGVFGAAYRNPLPVEAATVIDYVNKLSVDFRAAVDLPSGLNERGAFKADFTYATGSVKSDLLSCSNAGRIRYIDLGFFNLGETVGLGSDRVLKPSILSPLAGLRPSHCDKRTYGHLFIVGGSLRYPGSVLMTVKSALKSGVGLVTACVPEFLIADCAAVAPEAMWVGMPCNPDTGGMNLDGLKKIEELWHLATAIVIGPGMGRSKETTELLTQFFSRVNLPLVIDADALQQPWINALKTPAILTPHSGEFTRISSGCNLRTFVSQTGTTVVLKSSATRIMGSDGNTYISFYGGPVLARGGSGDLLAGLIGGLLAQTPHDLALAAARGAVWHGMAADLLARSQGQTATCVTELLAHLPEVLRTLNKT